ncbi:MAG TPA: ABC transporter ATP-binding protein [Ktedonosporobacter sp.]|nr:ABC transporter ATP-binding protein [Ktedonosporobacter sp.]
MNKNDVQCDPQPPSERGSQSNNASEEDWQGDVSRLPVVAVRHLNRMYQLGQTEVHALRDVSLDIYPGEFVAVMGPSGSGKTTFMNIIGCMDRPTSGDYRLTGMPISQLSTNQLADIRNRRIGFIFQSFNLLLRETALANVMLPLMYRGLPERVQRQQAALALQMVGLADRLNHLPTQLSGGQQQRVAIARALVNQPSLLLADEPTGNLDSHTSQEILELLQALNEQGITLIVVTHSGEVASVAKRRVEFKDGLVVQDAYMPAPRMPQAVEKTVRQIAGPRFQQNDDLAEEYKGERRG